MRAQNLAIRIAYLSHTKRHSPSRSLARAHTPLPYSLNNRHIRCKGDKSRATCQEQTTLKLSSFCRRYDLLKMFSLVTWEALSVGDRFGFCPLLYPVRISVTLSLPYHKQASKMIVWVLIYFTSSFVVVGSFAFWFHFPFATASRPSDCGPGYSHRHSLRS